MCFNAETSFMTWFVVLFAVWYLLKINDKYATWIALFVLTFTLIQLLEGFLHMSLRDKRRNEILTKLIFIALLLQPLIQTFMAYKTIGNCELKVAVIIYATIFLGTILYVITHNNFSSIRGENGHLVWQENGHPLFSGRVFLGTAYIIGILVPLLYLPIKYSIPILAIAIGTALYSYNRWNKTGEFASMWCFSAAATVLISLFLFS